MTHFLECVSESKLKISGVVKITSINMKKIKYW